MKRPWWIVMITLAVTFAAVNGPALAAPVDDDLAALLEQEVENREANLKSAKTRFDAGTVGQDTLLQAERELLQARQELVRAIRPQPVNPLTSPIPHLQITDASLGGVSDLLREVLEGQVNFILKDRAKELPVPDLDLRQTDLLTLLNILAEIVPGLQIRVTAGPRILPLVEVVALIEAAKASAPHGAGMMGMPGDMMMGGGFGGASGVSGVSGGSGRSGEGRGGTPSPGIEYPEHMRGGRMGMRGGTMMGGGFGGESGMFGMGGASPSGIEWSEQPTIIFEETTSFETEPRETLTLYLGGLLATTDFEDVLTSIETAWNLNPARSEPTLKFHEDTELLIAAGEPKQLEMIVEVINQLREMQEDLRARSKRSHQEEYAEMKQGLLEKVERERESMRGSADRVREEFGVRIKELEEVNARLEESRAMADVELKEAREQFETERNRMLTEMENEIRQIRERSFYERRELLEKIDNLERELQRKLDDANAPAEDGS